MRSRRFISLALPVLALLGTACGGSEGRIEAVGDAVAGRDDAPCIEAFGIPDVDAPFAACSAEQYDRLHPTYGDGKPTRADACRFANMGPICTEDRTPEPRPARPEASGELGSADDPLPAGRTVTLGDWDVTLDRWTPDATAAVLAASELNGPPSNGVYGVALLTVTYRGTDEGLPGLELSIGLVGGDGRVYQDADCSAFTAADIFDQPSVISGGTVSGEMCIDYPPSAADGSVLVIEETFAFDDVQSYWRTG